MESRRVQRLKLAMHSAAFSLFLSFLFSTFILPCPIQAAPGDLDPTFGTGGLVTTANGSANFIANALAIQSDGKLVAAGYSNSPSVFTLVRYNTDGSLDMTFG